MNPGPFLIIRKHFYLLLLAFTISAIKSCENTKTSLLLATKTKNPKTTLFTCFSLLSSCRFISSILLLLFALLI